MTYSPKLMASVDRAYMTLEEFDDRMGKLEQEQRIMGKLGRLALLGGVPVADMHFIRPAGRMDKISSKTETFELHTKNELTGHRSKANYKFLNQISPQTAWLLSDELALTTRKRVIRGYLLEEDYTMPSEVGYFERATAVEFMHRGIGAIALNDVWLSQATKAIRREVEDALDDNINLRAGELMFGPQPLEQRPLPGIQYLGDV